MTSNNSHPFNIPDQDRRIVVIECSNKYANPRDSDPDREKLQEEKDDYFAKLIKERDAKGFYKQLTTFFLNRDISNFDSRKFPRTEARKELTDSSKTIYEIWIERSIQRLRKGSWWDKEAGKEKPFTTDFAYGDMRRLAEKKGFLITAQPRAIAKLREFGVRSTQKRIDGKRIYVLAFDDDGKRRFAALIKENEEAEKEPEKIQVGGFPEEEPIQEIETDMDEISI
jgi:hypothetical protein